MKFFLTLPVHHLVNNFNVKSCSQYDMSYIFFFFFWDNFSRCSLTRLKLILLGWLPILEWLPQYPVKEYLAGDVMSGASVAVLHLPQGLYV